MFEKNLALSELYDLYAPLVSEKKRKAFELYYEEDLSLFEIAQELNISRQGVRDLLSRTASELEGYESALGLRQKRKALRLRMSELDACLSSCDKQLRDKVAPLEEEILSLFGM